MAGGSASLSDRLEDMREADDSLTHYAVTLTADEEGRAEVGTQSVWVGMSDTSPRRELRRACAVIGSRMLQRWREVGTLGLAVSCREEMGIFLYLGGNAVVEEALARDFFPSIFGQWEVVPTGIGRTTEIERVDSSALRRAPTPKLRMRILQRDNYRCRVCGRRTEDDTDVQLHVHHFIPWAMGGLTDERNLVTLCHTCHSGLDPPF